MWTNTVELHLKEVFGVSQIHSDRKQAGGCQGLGKRDDGQFLFDGYKVLVWVDENLLEMDVGDGGITVYVVAPNCTLKTGNVMLWILDCIRK